MSATNRGSDRVESDFYPTPLESFTPLIQYLNAAADIWEPACGDRRLIYQMRAYGLNADGADIKDGYDFLKDTDSEACIVTNPPFSLAFEFCQHAVAHASEVFLLLRLNFLASKKRREWFNANEPSALFVLSERPKFINGKSDSCDYALFYWGTRWKGIRHL